MRNRCLLAGLLLGLSIASRAQAPPGEELHTRVSLLADVVSAPPGGVFTAGVLLEMEKGWHTYWKNPGEAGLPTEVAWALPPGMEAGEILWPVPTKYNESGEVLTYGYADRVLLLVPIRVAPDALPGSVQKLRARVQWLECERICQPGAADVELDVRIGSAGPDTLHQNLFRTSRALLPQPAPSSRVEVSHRLEGNSVVIMLRPSGEGELAISGGALPDFYPEALEDIGIGRTLVEAGPRQASLRMELAPYDSLSGERLFRGVLVYGLAGDARMCAELAFPLPESFLANLRPPGRSREGESGGILSRDFQGTRMSSGVPPAVFLLFAVLGGLLLNIMPCVLPVIALKVFGLVRMAGESPRRVRRLGLLFCLGILVSFLALAVLVIGLQAAGEQVGWGFQFQEPLFVILMGAVVFVFGLSLFGVFEIRLPAGFTRAAATAGGEGGTHAGLSSFGEGVFATILATPCTAPFLGSALGFAFSQPWWMTLMIFSGAAFGMALPYLLLTARPGWVRFLPKPGAWMETAKQFMGFLMMATMLWLLFVLGRQLGMEAVIYAGAFLLALGMGCWILGRFATLTAGAGRRLAAWGVAAAVAAGGYAFFISPVLEARETLGTAGTPPGAEAVPWESFSLERLEAALAGDRTVFIDFTADWCLTCKVNERTVLADPEVVRAFRTMGVLPIKADWTGRNPDITRLLAKFGRSGVPLYVIFPAGKPHAPIVLPEVITTGIVLEALASARKE
ncbi:MAG: thioredoxin family protein [Bacteroidota bacterium]